MVRYDTILFERQIINDLCVSLKSATITNEGFIKSPDSVCRIQINMKDDRIISFGFRKKGAATCLDVNSDGEYGWNYGKLKANDFGFLIRKICDH